MRSALLPGVAHGKRNPTKLCQKGEGKWRCDAMPLLTWNVLGAPRHQRPNFDGFIYINYASPRYSARISAIYFLSFGRVCLGSVTVRWPPCATRSNEAERRTYGRWVKLRSHFKPFADHSLRNFGTTQGTLRAFQCPCPIVYIVFRSDDVRHWVSKSSKNRTNVNVFDPQFFSWGGGRDNPNVSTACC